MPGVPVITITGDVLEDILFSHFVLGDGKWMGVKMRNVHRRSSRVAQDVLTIFPGHF